MKRAKLDEQADSAAAGAGGDTDQSSSPRWRKKQGPKTITFDEVYQNGNAMYKHFIVEYPLHSAQFYILKCDEHGVHFNTNPLAGAAKHLHSAQHGNMSKERAQAVELLGHVVLGCDANLAAKNNALFKKMLDDGTYKIFNMNQLSKTTRRSMGYPVDPDPSPQKPQSEPPLQRSSTFRGIIDPVAGELYLAYWMKDKKNYAVMVLPWGSLEPAGMSGTLAETGLLNRAPKCYIVDPNTHQIQGWAPGIDATKREFPVLYFDGRM